jgi:hypothetical protein
MSLDATHTACFSSYRHIFTKCSSFSSTLLEVRTHEDALLPHISIDLLQGHEMA